MMVALAALDLLTADDRPGAVAVLTEATDEDLFTIERLAVRLIWVARDLRHEREATR
jgi:hypothetical protein